jgi:hypothetical protein
MDRPENPEAPAPEPLAPGVVPIEAPEPPAPTPPPDPLEGPDLPGLPPTEPPPAPPPAPPEPPPAPASKAKGKGGFGQPATAWTEVQDEVLRELRGVQGMPIEAISIRLGRCVHVVTKRLRALHIKAPEKPRKGKPVPAPKVEAPKPAGLNTLPPLPSLAVPLYIIPPRPGSSADRRR